jgi:hypothetical protein
VKFRQISDPNFSEPTQIRMKKSQIQGNNWLKVPVLYMIKSQGNGICVQINRENNQICCQFNSNCSYDYQNKDDVHSISICSTINHFTKLLYTTLKNFNTDSTVAQGRVEGSTWTSSPKSSEFSKSPSCSVLCLTTNLGDTS